MDTKFLIGLGFDEATKLVNASGFSWRVVSTNGKPLVLLNDYRGDRMNLEVENGTITKVTIG